MALLVRKLLLDNWPEEGFTGTEDEIPADCVTGPGIQTTDNQLSVWKISDKAELSEAVLALVSDFKTVPTQGVSVVLLDEAELNERGIVAEQHAANVKITGLGERHHDLMDLNHKRIGQLALHIIKQIEAGEYEEVTVKTIVRILYEAKEAGRLNFDHLKKEFREGLEAQRAKYAAE